MILKVNPVTPLASPLGEEDHEVAKGWTVVRMIMTLDMDVTAAGGQDRDGASYRRSALHTLCLFEAFPSRGNEKYREAFPIGG